MKTFNRIAVLVLALCITSTAQEIKYESYSNPDGTIDLQIPVTWDTLKLNDEAEVQVGNEQDEEYLIILSESKEDMFGWTIQKHSYVTLGNLLSGLLNPMVKGPKRLKIYDNEAIQFEIDAVTQGLKIVYIHTTIETETSFNQVLAWSLKSRYSENKDILQKVIHSFKEK